MAKKICLVPFCDGCGRALVRMIYYKIDGQDLCLKCTAKKLGFTLNLKHDAKRDGGADNAR